MAIAFNEIQSDIRVPLFYAEISNAAASYFVQRNRALIIGQSKTALSAGQKVLTYITSADQAAQKYGWGSMLHRMVQAFKMNNPGTELWVAPLEDDAEGVKAAWTVTLSGTTTAAGVFSLYIAGECYPVAIPSGVTAADAATLIKKRYARSVNSVDLVNSLPVTVTVAGAVLTLTAKNAGTVANDIDVRMNYLGQHNDEKTPKGLTVAIASSATGATDPATALTTAFAMVGDEEFDFVVNPYNDSSNIAAAKAWSADRWGPLKQLYGHVFGAMNGSVSSLITWGEAQNDQHLSIMGYNDSPTWRVEVAAAFAGRAAQSLSIDPARTVQSLPLRGVKPPILSKRWKINEANSLLFAGISTFYVQGDTCRIQRAITTYQQNEWGAEDPSYLDIETLFTLARITREIRSMVLNKFPRMKLAHDGTPLSFEAAVVTPKTIKGELIALYDRLARAGLVQNPAGFTQQLVVELDADDPNRVNVKFPPYLINNLRVFATQVEFRLQF